MKWCYHTVYENFQYKWDMERLGFTYKTGHTIMLLCRNKTESNKVHRIDQSQLGKAVCVLDIKREWYKDMGQNCKFNPLWAGFTCNHSTLKFSKPQSGTYKSNKSDCDLIIYRTVYYPRILCLKK